MKAYPFVRLCLVIWALIASANVLFGQHSVFTYQGILNAGSVAASGNFDLTFAVFDASSAGNKLAGPITNTSVLISNGLFQTALDFGTEIFNGPRRWLEIGVRPANGNPFTTLAPRQEISSTPYAIRALSAATASGVSAGAAVKSINGLVDDISLAAGTNITLTPSGNTLIIASAGPGGTTPLTLSGPASIPIYNTNQVVASGAGTAAANGTYTIDASRLHGQLFMGPVFTNSGSYFIDGGGNLAASSYWAMAPTNLTSVLYEGDGAQSYDSTLIDTNWMVAGGDTGLAPAPVVQYAVTGTYQPAVYISNGGVIASNLQATTAALGTVAITNLTALSLIATGAFSGSLAATNTYLDATNFNNEAWASERIASLYKFKHFNRYGYTNTIAKIRKGQTIRVLIAGEGLTELLEHWVFGLLDNNFTFAGAGPSSVDVSTAYFPPAFRAFSPYPVGSAYYTNGQIATGGAALFYPSYIVLPSAGAQVTYLEHGTNLVGNKLELEYIGLPGGGVFKIQTNLSNGAWTDLPGATAISTSTSSGVTNLQRFKWTTPANMPASAGVRVQWVSGVSYIVGTVVEDTTVQGGYMQFTYRRQGANFIDMLDGGPGVWTNAIGFWAPDLLIFEPLSHQYDNLKILFDTFRTTFPNMDVVVFANQPYSTDTLTEQLTRNKVARDMCVTNGYSFFDTYGVMDGTTNTIIKRGFGDGGVHPNATFFDAISKVFYGWLNL